MFNVIIPARLQSTRLPNKPLLDIAGLPMVIRTAQQAQKSAAKNVIIATDSDAIMTVAHEHGLTAIMTKTDHISGTDRLAEACQALNLSDDELVVNVQGDEPLIDPDLIDQVAQTLLNTPTASIATAASFIDHADTLFNPNSVKVVCDTTGNALYFSRAPIPWARDALQGNDQKKILAPGLSPLHHIGLYAYRVRFLLDFPNLTQGTLEYWESLEQLRALEHGYRIQVLTCSQPPAPGVDTLADLERVRSLF